MPRSDYFVDSSKFTTSVIDLAGAPSPPPAVTQISSDESDAGECPSWLRRLHKREWLDYETLFRDINTAAKVEGFYITSNRSNNKVDGAYTRYDLVCGEGRDKHADRIPKGIRNASKSGKKGCEWKAKAVRYKKLGGVWKFDCSQHQHNHDLNPDTAGYLPGHRRLERTPQVVESVLKYGKQPKNTSGDIAATLQTDFPEAKIRNRDVLNILAAAKVAKAGALTPTQQFLNSLQSDPAVFVKLHRKGDGDEPGAPDGDGDKGGKKGKSLAYDNDRPIDRVFWTYDWCVDQWRKNPEVWSLDCTYKVNRFDMPLLQICGVTCMHTTFNIGYCLLSGEKEESFYWVLRVLERLLTDKNIARPSVIISDYDRAFKRAARAVFNHDTQHQICLWHVMKNVAFNVKKKWIGTLDGTALGNRGSDGSHLRDDDEDHDRRGDDGVNEVNGGFINPANNNNQARIVAVRLLTAEDRRQHLNEATRNALTGQLNGRAPPNSGRMWLDNADGILSAWAAVVYSDSSEQFWERWRTLMAEFPGQKPLVEYLLKTYLPIAQEFAAFHIKWHRNFGIRVTSRTEGAHGILKRLLKNRLVDLATLLGAIEGSLSRLKERFAAMYAEQTSKSVRRYSANVLRRLRYLVSFAALELITEQIGLAEKWIKDNPPSHRPECTGRFRAQYGLPCWHEIRCLLLAGPNAVLVVPHVDLHWRLKPDTPLPAAFLKLVNEDDPDKIITRRNAPIVNGPQPIPRSAYPESLPQSGGTRRDTSTRCDPAHDAPARQPPPKKPRLTMTQINQRQEAQIASLMSAVNTLVTINASQPPPSTAPAAPTMAPPAVIAVASRTRGNDEPPVPSQSRAAQYGERVIRF